MPRPRASGTTATHSRSELPVVVGHQEAPDGLAVVAGHVDMDALARHVLRIARVKESVPNP